MKLFLIASTLLIVSTGCASTPGQHYRAVRFDSQQSEMENDDLDDEDPMEKGRITYQYMPREEGVEDTNHFKGVISQFGLSYGESTQEVADGLIEIDVEQYQFDAGLRYYQDLGTRFFQPFIGGGLSQSYTILDDGDFEDDYFLFGGYGEAGVEAAIGKHGRFGVGVRYDASAPSLTGEDADFDAAALFFSLGWSF